MSVEFRVFKQWRTHYHAARELFDKGGGERAVQEMLCAADLMGNTADMWEPSVQYYVDTGSFVRAVSFYCMAADNLALNASLVRLYLLAAQHCEITNVADDVTLAMNDATQDAACAQAIWSQYKFYHTHLLNAMPEPSTSTCAQSARVHVLDGHPLALQTPHCTTVVSQGCPRLFSNFVPSKSIATQRGATFWIVGTVVAPDDCCYFVLARIQRGKLSYSNPFTFTERNCVLPVDLDPMKRGWVEVHLALPVGHACVHVDGNRLLVHHTAITLETIETT
jgi:hypothetical protein